MYKNSLGSRCLSAKRRSMRLNIRSSLRIHPKKWCKERSNNFGHNCSKQINSYSNSSRWWCLEEVKRQLAFRVVLRSTCLMTDHGNKTRWEICQVITAWTIIQEGRAERLLFLTSIHHSKETRLHKTSCLIILVLTLEVDLGRQGTEIWRAA